MVDGLEIAPQACLLDSGATAGRMGAHVAELCGVDLSDAPETRIAVGGALVTARMAEVNLSIADDADSYEWTAPHELPEPAEGDAVAAVDLVGFDSEPIAHHGRGDRGAPDRGAVDVET